MKHQYDSGKVAEYRFAARCIEESLVVCWPSSEKTSIDFVVCNNEATFKIQVKSTKDKESYADRYSIDLRHNVSGYKHKQVYEGKSFDFLVAHISPINTWYIIPEDKIRGLSKVLLYPHRKKIKNGAREDWENYREAWHLLKE